MKITKVKNPISTKPMPKADTDAASPIQHAPWAGSGPGVNVKTSKSYKKGKA